jgi:Glycosyl hydrolases family 16
MRASELVLSAPIGAGGGTPSNTSAPVVSGSTVSGDTLSCTEGLWSNTPLSYAYQWVYAGTGDISGATSSTYVLGDGDLGYDIYCTVTASNLAGSAAANSNTVGPITSSSPQPNGPSGSWTIIFQEDFAALNNTTWNTRNGWTNQNGVTTYAANIAVAASVCTLSLVSSTSGAEIATRTAVLAVGNYIEFRAKFSEGWSAVWTSGADWPANGEIDVGEMYANHVTSNYHSSSADLTSGTIPGTWNDGNWHTFGALRGASEISIYWDGELADFVGATSNPYSSSDSGGDQTIILTMGNGNSNTISSYPQTLIVDYVYVWEPA